MDAHGVVCICSRGLVFSRTIEATDKNMRRAEGQWVREFTHCESIPEAQNIIVEQARQHHTAPSGAHHLRGLHSGSSFRYRVREK